MIIRCTRCFIYEMKFNSVPSLKTVFKCVILWKCKDDSEHRLHLSLTLFMALYAEHVLVSNIYSSTKQIILCSLSKLH